MKNNKLKNLDIKNIIKIEVINLNIYMTFKNEKKVIKFDDKEKLINALKKIRNFLTGIDIETENISKYDILILIMMSMILSIAIKLCFNLNIVIENILNIFVTGGCFMTLKVIIPFCETKRRRNHIIDNLETTIEALTLENTKKIEFNQTKVAQQNISYHEVGEMDIQHSKGQKTL